MNVPSNDSFKLSKKDWKTRASKGRSGNCVVVGGALVQKGENVEFRGIGGAFGCSRTEVGEIIEIEDRCNVNRRELKQSKIGKGPEGERLVLVRKLAMATGRNRITNRRTHPHVPDALIEVVATNQFQWVLAAAVESIAFVFHADSVNSGKYLCGGMQNAYIIRQAVDAEDDAPKPILESEHQAFKSHSNVKESHSKRIWNGLAALNEASFKALSAGGKWDGRTKHVHMQGCNFELAWYLIERLTATGSDIIQDEIEYSRARKRLNADLSVSNKRIKTKGCLLRILEENALSQFRMSLGSTFGAANTKAVPTLKEVNNSKGRVKDTVHVCDHDLVRIVTCGEDDFDNDTNREIAPLVVSNVTNDPVNHRDTLADIKGLQRQPRRLPYPGIDLEFLQSATGITDLHLALKFKKLKGASQSVKRAQNLMSVASESDVSGTGTGAGNQLECHNEKPTLAKGDEFIYGGATYEISSVSRNGKTVKCCKAGYNEMVSLTLPMEEAEALVNSFLQS